MAQHSLPSGDALHFSIVHSVFAVHSEALLPSSADRLASPRISRTAALMTAATRVSAFGTQLSVLIGVRNPLSVSFSFVVA